MTLVIRKKLNHSDALATIRDIEEWFRNNPKRETCATDWFDVRRGFVSEDVLTHTIPLEP